MKTLVLVLALLSFSLPALGSGMPDGQVCDQKGADALFDSTAYDRSGKSSNDQDGVR